MISGRTAEQTDSSDEIIMAPLIPQPVGFFIRKLLNHEYRLATIPVTISCVAAIGLIFMLSNPQTAKELRYKTGTNNQASDILVIDSPNGQICANILNPLPKLNRYTTGPQYPCPSNNRSEWRPPAGQPQ